MVGESCFESVHVLVEGLVVSLLHGEEIEVAFRHKHIVLVLEEFCPKIFETTNRYARKIGEPVQCRFGQLLGEDVAVVRLFVLTWWRTSDTS